MIKVDEKCNWKVEKKIINSMKCKCKNELKKKLKIGPNMIQGLNGNLLGHWKIWAHSQSILIMGLVVEIIIQIHY